MPKSYKNNSYWYLFIHVLLNGKNKTNENNQKSELWKTSTYHTFVDFSLTVYWLQLLAFWLQILLFLTLLLHFLYIQAQLLVWLVLDPLCKQEWFIYAKSCFKNIYKYKLYAFITYFNWFQCLNMSFIILGKGNNENLQMYIYFVLHYQIGNSCKSCQNHAVRDFIGHF